MKKNPAKINNFIQLILAILLVPIFLSGCSALEGWGDNLGKLKTNITSLFNNEKEQEAVVSVVQDFFDALISGNYEKAYSLIYISGASKKSKEDFKKEFLSITRVVSIEINWVEVKNNVAVVGIDLIDTYDGEEKIYKDISVSLIKNSEETWKINFWY